VRDDHHPFNFRFSIAHFAVIFPLTYKILIPYTPLIKKGNSELVWQRLSKKSKGDEILIEARILAVSDVVESMASHRPYRPALGLNAAL
jgi:hypothetical protein